jgi:hypothetical protein
MMRGPTTPDKREPRLAGSGAAVLRRSHDRSHGARRVSCADAPRARPRALVRVRHDSHRAGRTLHRAPAGRAARRHGPADADVGRPAGCEGRSQLLLRARHLPGPGARLLAVEFNASSQGPVTYESLELTLSPVAPGTFRSLTFANNLPQPTTIL